MKEIQESLISSDAWKQIVNYLLNEKQQLTERLIAESRNIISSQNHLETLTKLGILGEQIYQCDKFISLPKEIWEDAQEKIVLPTHRQKE